jgi:hypothetical protein
MGSHKVFLVPPTFEPGAIQIPCRAIGGLNGLKEGHKPTNTDTYCPPAMPQLGKFALLSEAAPLQIAS